MRTRSSLALTATVVLLLLPGVLLPGVAAQIVEEIEWESVGPTGVSILALLPHPIDPLTLYAVVDAHSVYKSTDGGETWQIQNQGMEELTVLSLCIADETGQTLYAGTLGGGVFRSVDGGETWQLTEDIASGITDIEASPIWGVLSLAAVEETVIYAGTGGGGIYRSKDQGESWVPINQGLGLTPGLGLDVHAILPNPEHTGTIIIGTNWGIFKSEDEGANWRQTFSSITTALALGDDGQTIYAGSVEGLVRSEDGGEHWEVLRQARLDGLLEVQALLVDDASLYVGASGGLYQNTDGQRWEDRTGNLPLGGLVVRGIVKRGRWLCIGTGRGIFRSEDNGASWVETNTGLPENGLIVKRVVFGGDEENSLFIGTWGGGIYRSVDQGTSWTGQNHGLGMPYVTELTASNDKLYAATWRAFYASDDGGDNWAFFAQPTYSERFVVPDPSRDGILALFRLWETDAENTWRSVGRLVRNGDDGNRWQVVESLATFDVTDILISSGNDRTLYVATRQNGIYQSTDGGTQWRALDQDTFPQNIHTLGLGGEHGDILFAGTSSGIERREPDGVWETTILGSFHRIVTDPSHPNRVYAVNAEGALIISEDYGQTWKSAGFADVPINDIAVDPSGDLIYAATEGHSVLRGGVQGLFSRRLSSVALTAGLVGLTTLLAVGVLLTLSLKHYPAYVAEWTVARDHPLQQIIPLIAPVGDALDSDTLSSKLRAIEAFSTPDQMQGALDRLVERGLLTRKDDAYLLVHPWAAWIHRRTHRTQIPALAERIRTQHPLYTRTRDFFIQAHFRIEELGAEELMLLPQGQTHPQAAYGPVYTRLIAGRAPTGDDFTAVCEAASDRYGDDLSHRVALVISDRRPEPGARYRLYEIRQREGLSIIPLDISLFGQIELNRTANDILTSEIDQATGQQNLYAISTPVSSDLSFFGRERVLQEVIDLLDAGQPMGLFGLRKVGKTSLIQRIQGRLVERRPIALVDTQKTAQQQGVWSLYLDIIATFAAHLQRHHPESPLPNLKLWPNTEPPSSAMADAFMQDLQMLQATLGAPDKRNRPLLIVDEIDRLLPSGQLSGYEGFATLFGQLRAANQQAQMLDFIVVGVNADVNNVERWQTRDNELYRTLHEVWMPSMALDDVREMIVSLGLQIGVRYENQTLDCLAGCGGGQPFVIRQICSRAVEGKLNQGKLTVTLDQAQAAIEEFIFDDPYLREMWRTRLDETQRGMLRSLAKASEPLPRLELLPASQRQEALAALSALEDYTLVRREEGQYTIAWDVFRQWIRWVELGMEE